MKAFYIVTGTLSLILGILGIFLPLLPTTPFLLLTAALYMRGSRRMYGWLLGHRYLGPYILNYREKRAITLPSKLISVGLMWILMCICIFWIVDPLWLKILLGVILVTVTIHILSFRTMKRSEVVKLVSVRSAEQIKNLAVMADKIWNEYFSSLLTQGQIDYMIDKFQSEEAIGRQISQEKYQYYFINAGGENAGYIGLKPGEGKLMLSKIYISAEHRGKGYAREAFSFIENMCLSKCYSSVWLTVNRHNTSSIEVYKKRGFNVIREQVVDIGNGYVMDDFVMEKPII